MISGETLLMYLGVAFMLLGSYIIIADAIALTPSVEAALGGFIFSIGLIMSFVGYKGREKEEEILSRPIGGSELNVEHPLSYLGAENEGTIQNRKKSSGNKALGFVLIAIGIFLLSFMVGYPFLFYCCSFPDVISLFEVLGMLFLSPLSLLGIVCLSFGVSFRRLMSSR